jgi:hypothetical protein
MLAPATIWRKAQDPRPGGDSIIRSSDTAAMRRSELSELRKQLRAVGFGFPDAAIVVISLSSDN